VTIAGCDRVALGVQVVSSSEAHHLWRVWKTCSEENVESDVHRPRKGGVRQRISPSKASKASKAALVKAGRIGIEHRASNVKGGHRFTNIEHRASNIEHRASNIEHRASNIEHRFIYEHRVSNIEHRTSNIEHRTSTVLNERWCVLSLVTLLPHAHKPERLAVSHSTARFVA
jgi:hypothetical protein